MGPRCRGNSLAVPAQITWKEGKCAVPRRGRPPVSEVHGLQPAHRDHHKNDEPQDQASTQGEPGAEPSVGEAE